MARLPIRIPAILLLAAALSAPGSLARAEPPAVVATVKPVHALVAGVMQGVGEPALLIEGNQSPHDFTMRPSDARLLAKAELVFWVGHALEAFLEKPLEVLASGAVAVSLLDTPGLTLLEARAGGMHGHGPAPHGGHLGNDIAVHAEDRGGHGDTVAATRTGEDHGHGDIDPHIWLDPRNAQSMVHEIATRLAAVDAANADRYRANAAAMASRIGTMDAAIAGRLAPVRQRPYLVFHDAYQYFESHFDLNGVGTVTVSPDARPGAARLRELRAAIAAMDVVCVFSEPQFESPLVDTILDGTGARRGQLDPLGADLPAGPDQYEALMQALADGIVNCLRS